MPQRGKGRGPQGCRCGAEHLRPTEGRPLPQLMLTPLCPSGPRLSGGHSLHETSTVLVETVTKSSSSRGSSYSSIPKFSSDASKVVTRGPGLSQAFVGQKNSFTVDCSKAGMLREEAGGVRGWASAQGYGGGAPRACGPLG